MKNREISKETLKARVIASISVAGFWEDDIDKIREKAWNGDAKKWTSRSEFDIMFNEFYKEKLNK
jgi:predicted lactoylglutathione lyase